jgi:hypothetical protein
MASSVVKKVVAALTGEQSTLGSEMPETPGLRLPQGKISTATRRRPVLEPADAPKER